MKPSEDQGKVDEGDRREIAVEGILEVAKTGCFEGFGTVCASGAGDCKWGTGLQWLRDLVLSLESEANGYHYSHSLRGLMRVSVQKGDQVSN